MTYFSNVADMNAKIRAELLGLREGKGTNMKDLYPCPKCKGAPIILQFLDGAMNFRCADCGNRYQYQASK